MFEAYKCPDGQTVLFGFDEDTLYVSVTAPNSSRIGNFHFELIDEHGEPISVLEDAGQSASLRLAVAVLDEAWNGRGIAERVSQLVSDEMHLPAAVDATLNQ
ncbi:MAG: hypothetical protein JWR10_1407 [Rubritepida sp.]|nr:hypothetical protein [Rubritepida sp.]